MYLDLRFWSLSGSASMSDSDADWLNTAATVVNTLLELRGKGSKGGTKVAEGCFASFFKVCFPIKHIYIYI